MTDTPNAGLPLVPEGTLDPAAGLNLALLEIDALLQPSVLSMALSSPPGSPADGDLYIVGAAATGAWAGHEDDLARYVAEGTFWQFYIAGLQVHLVLNQDDGGLYAYVGTSGWAAALPGSTGAQVLTESTTARSATPSDASKYIRFTNAAAKTYTFNGAAGYIKGSEFHARNVGAADLTISTTGGMAINAPAGGSLVVPQGGTVTVKVISDDGAEADLFGVTS